MSASSRPRLILTWLAQLLGAAILGMAGSMKLIGAADAVALFTLLGAEPWGRLALGTLEVLTALGLLWPRTAARAALVGSVLMVGVIGNHLFKIGILYGGDPSLFIMAVTILIASGATYVLRSR